MRDDSFTELGLASDFSITENPDEPQTFLFTFQSENTGEESYLITAGVAKYIWFYLMRILFPRTDQITARAPTMSLSAAMSLTVVFAAKVWQRKEDGLIEISAGSATVGWSIILTEEEAHNLRACLEQIPGVAD